VASLGALATATGLALLVWAATTGPVRVLGTATATRSPRPVRLPSERPPRVANVGHSPTYRDLTSHVRPSVDLSWLGALIGYAAVAAICFGLFLLLRELWRNRWRAPQKPPEVAFDVRAEAAVLDTLARDAGAQRATLEAGGPRDSIVACWLRLEEIVAETPGGVTARPSETSTELVTRVLHSLDVDPRPVASLAALYREARFSEHPMGEDSRDAARSALRALHEELLGLGARR
jgi:hypothetical protein